MLDRYTKVVLTVIAGALIYLCIVMTAFPAVSAQSSARPGEPTGPAPVVVVGWRSAEPVPVVAQRPVQVVTTTEPLRVVGTVTTERSSQTADRVVLVGWERAATRERPNPSMIQFDEKTPGLPVRPQQ
jgi:hypothetical protein